MEYSKKQNVFLLQPSSHKFKKIPFSRLQPLSINRMFGYRDLKIYKDTVMGKIAIVVICQRPPGTPQAVKAVKAPIERNLFMKNIMLREVKVSKNSILSII